MFRWGIIGTGQVARKFVLGLRHSQGGAAAVVHSRDPARRQTFADDFGLLATADVATLTGTDVDAVYIATPPASHRALALACIAAGKPVLIEKPMAGTVADTRTIVEAATAAGVFCMEGAWTRFLPVVARLRQLLAEHAIGEVRSLTASFGLTNPPDSADSQFDPALGGGALAHRGHYPLSLALDLLGPAVLVSSAARIGTTGVDEDVVLLLRHEAGPLSSLRASLRAPLSNDLAIEGTHGRIRLREPIYRPWRLTVARSSPTARNTAPPRFESWREGGIAQGLQQRLAGLRRARITTADAHYRGNGYGHEADAVMAAVRRGDREHRLMRLDQSLAMATLMDAARALWDGSTSTRSN